MTAVEHQMVFRLRIDAILQTTHHEVDILGAQTTLIGIVRTQFEPWGDTADGAPDSLKIRHLLTESFA